MTYITAARFAKEEFEKDQAVRDKADEVQNHLNELALDVGLDPERNVTRTDAGDEIRIGVSEEMDQYLREAPGGWRFY